MIIRMFRYFFVYFFLKQEGKYNNFCFICRGYVYSRNLEFGFGKVVYGNKFFIYRLLVFDNEVENLNFCQIIDLSLLKVNIILYFSNNNIKF